MGPMEPRVSLITLGVADLGRATAFYHRLGWTPSPRFENADVSFFQLGGMILGLYGLDELADDAGVPRETPAAGRPSTHVTLAHNVRTRQEVDAVIEEARQAGATVVKPAGETDWGGYSGYFADPDGHLWEVAWNPGFPIADDGTIRLPE